MTIQYRIWSPQSWFEACARWLLTQHLLGRAVHGVQDGLVGDVVGARAQVRARAQVDELELAGRL
jgi:hypothetical protein